MSCTIDYAVSAVALHLRSCTSSRRYFAGDSPVIFLCSRFDLNFAPWAKTGHVAFCIQLHVELMHWLMRPLFVHAR